VITFKEIEAARDRIAGAVYYSPCPLMIPLSENRAFATSDVSTVNVLCTVETRDHQHFADLRAQLKSHGVETYETK
jgi:hypothetical protein